MSDAWTPWETAWTPAALRDLRRVDRPIRERVNNAVKRLAATGQGDVIRLTAVRPPEWRLRVGDWRVRFDWDTDNRVIVILHVFHRRDAFRDR